MDGLEKKLEEIQSDIGCCTYHMQSKEFRESIKQAFIDDGWTKFTTTPDYDANAHRYDDTYVSKKAEFVGSDLIIPRQEDMHVHVCSCGQIATTRFMTGQEWYDKFQKEYLEIYRNNRDRSGDYIASKASEAAKKAAGIS